MKKLIIFLLFCTPAHAQLRHSIILERTGAYFWDSPADGAPFSFDNEFHWYIPTSINYLVTQGKWGVSVGVNDYGHRYKDKAFPLSLPGVLIGHDPYSRRYTAGYLNIVRQLAASERAEVLAMAGYAQYFESSSEIGYYLNTEGAILTDHAFGDVSRPGVNVGVVARYRFWKGFTVQATAAHSKVFGATDFSNISNVRLGCGYTFGNGVNRSKKRELAP